MRPTVLAVLLLGLAACAPAGTPTPAEVAALPDPVARLAALDEVVFSGAWDQVTLEAACASFEDAPLAEACRGYLGRPHLFRGKAVARAREPAADTPAGCPVTLDAVLADPRQPCSCLARPLARDECAFRRAQDGKDPTQALQRCLDAGVLKPACLYHRAEALGGRCAPTEGPESVGWLALWAEAAALEEAVSYWEAGERARLLDVVYAGQMRCAFQRPAAFDGGFSTSVPAGARPHLRAALAWHMVAGLPDADLAALRFALRHWELTGQLPTLSPDTPDLPAGPWSVAVRDPAAWCRTQGCRADGEDLAQLRYFGMGQRLLAPDPDADRTLCLLEAAARLRSAPVPLLDEAADDPSEAVRLCAGSLR
ncbi:MAG: hypothetical protein ABIO70_01370 [Pseudomonadota bacterium]